MKSLFLTALFTFALPLFADEPLFSLVEGEGKNIQEAYDQAQKQMPKGWGINLDQDPLVECAQELAQAFPDQCDFEGQTQAVKVSLPIIKTES